MLFNLQLSCPCFQRGDSYTGLKPLAKEVLIQLPEVSRVLNRSAQSTGERLLQQRGLVDVAEDLVDGRTGVFTVDSKRFEFPEDAGPATQSYGHGRAGVGEGRTPVVQSPVDSQPVDRGVDLVVFKSSLLKSLANLGHRQLTACEPAERHDVWVLRQLFPHSRNRGLVQA